MNRVIVSQSGDGYMNLALDEFLLEEHRTTDSDGVTLCFFVNSKAVIIGRNQNAWRECALDAMERDGVQLVRRHTGGGAVFHDAGNLNFSFIANEKYYDKDRQNAVVLNALERFGIHAELTGRNDITVNGMKISGCAYALSGTARGMHGTLLIDTDMSMLAKYLKPSKLKLMAKGISSVRARVCNLAKIAPVTVDTVRETIIKEFKKAYGDCENTVFVRSCDDIVRSSGKFVQLYEKQRSWEWRMGTTPAFDAELTGRLSFGEYQLLLTVRHGIIEGARLYTDALDAGLSDRVEAVLSGMRFEKKEMARALETAGSDALELSRSIMEG